MGKETVRFCGVLGITADDTDFVARCTTCPVLCPPVARNPLVHIASSPPSTCALHGMRVARSEWTRGAHPLLAVTAPASNECGCVRRGWGMRAWVAGCGLAVVWGQVAVNCGVRLCVPGVGARAGEERGCRCGARIAVLGGCACLAVWLVGVRFRFRFRLVCWGVAGM